MTKIKKTINRLRVTGYWLRITLLLVICWLLVALSLVTPAQSQTPSMEITLTWSTDTYIPLNYPGKALPTRGSIIEVVANIDSPDIDPQKVIYYWFLNDRIQKLASGEGKQVFKFNIGESITRKHLVKVEIRNREGTLLGVSSYLSLKPEEPQIILKTKKPLPSLLALKQYQISANQEVNFVAQPYFFNIKEVAELNYSWSLGGQEASQISQDYPNILTLRIGELAEAISRELKVGAVNNQRPIEKAQAEIELVLKP
jgi:hypothetical protein